MRKGKIVQTKVKDQRNRKLQKTGQLTIPADIRARYGFHGGGSVTMKVNEDGTVTISPDITYCAICRNSVATKKTKTSVPVCKVCASEIGGLYVNNKKSK